MAIAGIVLSAISIVVIIITTAFYGLIIYGITSYNEKTNSQSEWDSYLDDTQDELNDLEDYFSTYYDDYYRDYDI